MVDKRKVGQFAESIATRILSEKGYRIIDRNFRTRFSEIDIIALDKDTLVFVEVKARWSRKFGNPEEAVNSLKLRKIKKAGELYAMQKPSLPKKMRIDVVSLIFDGQKLISEKVITAY